jgi:2,4-diaminopentanoate dehydrogenase
LAREIRVLVWGLGDVGRGVVRAVAARKGAFVAGAVCLEREQEGKDVGEMAGTDGPMGVEATRNGNLATQLARPDAVVVSGSTSVDETFVAIETALAYKADVICLGDRTSCPWRRDAAFAERVGDLAERAGKTVLVAPADHGSLIDTVVVALTAACTSVDRVVASSMDDVSGAPDGELAALGVGLSPDEFRRRAAAGEIADVVDLADSVASIADAVGWSLTELRETTDAIVTEVAVKTSRSFVKAGMVAGCRHRAVGLRGDDVVIDLYRSRQVSPTNGDAAGDEIVISGAPPIHVRIAPRTDDTAETAALACNMIPLVMKARPGLVAMTDLPVPRGVAGDMRLLLQRERPRGRLRSESVPDAVADGRER